MKDSLSREEFLRMRRKKCMDRWEFYFKCIENQALSPKDPMVIAAMVQLNDIDRLIIKEGMQHLFHED